MHYHYFSYWNVPNWKTSWKYLSIPILKQHLAGFRSSHQKCSVKKSVLKIFGNFTGKRLCSSPFWIKLFKKRIQYRCFPAKFAKFVITCFEEHLQRLLLWVRNTIAFEFISNLNLYLKLKLKFSLNLNLNVSLKLNLKLKVNLNLNFNLKMQLKLYFHYRVTLDFDTLVLDRIRI